MVVSNDTSVTWRYDETASDFLFTYYAFLEGASTWYYDPVVSRLWLTNGTTFSLLLPDDAAAGDVCTYRGYYQPPGGSWLFGTFAFRLGMVTYAQTDSVDEFPLVSGENGKLWPAVEITMDEGVDLLCYYYNEDERKDEGGRTTDELPTWWYMRYLWGGANYLQYDGSELRRLRGLWYNLL